MKYIDYAITFLEFPDEVSLCINISGCPIHCEACHSKYLWKDEGNVLNEQVIDTLLANNKGVTLIGFMGGDSDPSEINKLAKYSKSKGVKVGWYSGCSELSKEIDLTNFDYVKLGPYIKEKGPLNMKTTNQVMLAVNHDFTKPIVVDITSRFWNI